MFKEITTCWSFFHSCCTNSILPPSYASEIAIVILSCFFLFVVVFILVEHKVVPVNSGVATGSLALRLLFLGFLTNQRDCGDGDDNDDNTGTVAARHAKLAVPTILLVSISSIAIVSINTLVTLNQLEFFFFFFFVGAILHILYLCIRMSVTI